MPTPKPILVDARSGAELCIEEAVVGAPVDEKEGEVVAVELLALVAAEMLKLWEPNDPCSSVSNGLRTMKKTFD